MRLEHCNSIARDPERVHQASYLLKELLKRKHVRIKEIPSFCEDCFRLEIRFGWFYFRRIVLKIEKLRRLEDGFDLNRIYYGDPKDLDVFMYVGWQEVFFCRVPNFLLQDFLDRMIQSENKEEKEIKAAKRLFGKYSKKLRVADKYLERDADAAWDFILKNDYDASKLSKWSIWKMHQEYLKLKIFKKEHIND